MRLGVPHRRGHEGLNVDQDDVRHSGPAIAPAPVRARRLLTCTGGIGQQFEDLNITGCCRLHESPDGGYGGSKADMSEKSDLFGTLLTWVFWWAAWDSNPEPEDSVSASPGVHGQPSMPLMRWGNNERKRPWWIVVRGRFATFYVGKVWLILLLRGC
ncbi:hypothetical protein GCM10009675_07000 [Prauserella alba]|uniref:Uncharacterized protein n=1 Tax=Prauserella alba TaxID=176898 RepID=A0ABP4FPX7_9PSEU